MLSIEEQKAALNDLAAKVDPAAFDAATAALSGVTPMTDKEALSRLIDLNDGVTEISHEAADMLFEEILLSHGYTETVEYYRSMQKWYA